MSDRVFSSAYEREKARKTHMAHMKNDVTVDLLKALKKLTTGDGRYAIPYEDYMQAIAAIARAEHTTGTTCEGRE